MCSCANYLQNINIKSYKIATFSHLFFFKVGDKMEGWMNHAIPINTEIEVLLWKHIIKKNAQIGFFSFTILICKSSNEKLLIDHSFYFICIYFIFSF